MIEQWSPGAESGFGVVLFNSTQAAIRAEKLLLAAGVPLKLVPVPRHLSANCGFAIRFSWAERAAVEQCIEASGPDIKAIQRL